VKLAPRIRTQADNITRIRGDFRLVQHNIEHESFASLFMNSH